MAQSTSQSDCCAVPLAEVTTAASTAAANASDTLDADEAADASAEPATHRVSTQRVAIEIEVAGHFESEQMMEVVLRPEVWREFPVLEAVTQGTAVQAGDTLVKLDTAKIDEAIVEAEHAAQTAALNLKRSEYELAILQETTPLDLEAARLRARNSREDREHFEQIGRDLTQRTAEHGVRSAENSLAYALEELTQLERMYTADDLVEDTEEMILQRQRHAVQRLEFALERARVEAEQTINVALPRRSDQLTRDEQRHHLALEQAEATLPLQLELRQLAQVKARRDSETTRQRLEHLRSDRQAMEIVAPCDGIVYYGRAERGRFAQASAMANKLRPHGSLSPNEVFMTIVQPRPLRVRVDVPEAQVRHVRAGLDAQATATAFPDAAFDAQVAAISPVPTTPGNFEAVITVADNDAGRFVMPGMACSITIVAYENPQAVVAPTKAVFGEGEQRFVYIRTAEGFQRREVRVGQTVGDKLEILDGLAADDEILLEEPQA